MSSPEGFPPTMTIFMAPTVTSDTDGNSLALETGTINRPTKVGAASSSTVLPILASTNTLQFSDNTLAIDTGTITRATTVGTTSTISGPSLPGDAASSQGANQAWIAGAVIGPIVLIVLLIGVFLLGRRSGRIKPVIEKEEAGVVEKKPPEKPKSIPELHEDSIVPTQELYGSLPSHPNVAEKPSNEPGAQELPANVTKTKPNNNG